MKTKLTTEDRGRLFLAVMSGLSILGQIGTALLLARRLGKLDWERGLSDRECPFRSEPVRHRWAAQAWRRGYWAARRGLWILILSFVWISSTSAQWVTPIAAHYVISANHFHPPVGSPALLRSVSLTIQGTIVEAWQIGSTDAWIGRLVDAWPGSVYDVAPSVALLDVVTVWRQSGPVPSVVNYLSLFGPAYNEPTVGYPVQLLGGDSGAPSFDSAGRVVELHHWTFPGANESGGVNWTVLRPTLQLMISEPIGSMIPEPSAVGMISCAFLLWQLPAARRHWGGRERLPGCFCRRQHFTGENL